MKCTTTGYSPSGTESASGGSIVKGKRMTGEQEQHLQDVKTFIAERMDAKYRAGQKEHGGNLWTKPTLPMLLEEVTDLVVYAQTLDRQTREAHDKLQDALVTQDWGAVASALALLSGQLRPPVG